MLSIDMILTTGAQPVGGPEGSLPLRPLRLTLRSLCECWHEIMDHRVAERGVRPGCQRCPCTEEFEGM